MEFGGHFDVLASAVDDGYEVAGISAGGVPDPNLPFDDRSVPVAGVDAVEVYLRGVGVSDEGVSLCAVDGDVPVALFEGTGGPQGGGGVGGAGGVAAAAGPADEEQVGLVVIEGAGSGGVGERRPDALSGALGVGQDGGGAVADGAPEVESPAVGVGGVALLLSGDEGGGVVSRERGYAVPCLTVLPGGVDGEVVQRRSEQSPPASGVRDIAFDSDVIDVGEGAAGQVCNASRSTGGGPQDEAIVLKVEESIV